MDDYGYSELIRAYELLKSFLRDHPEHDQADIRVFDAYEALRKAIDSEQGNFGDDDWRVGY